MLNFRNVVAAALASSVILAGLGSAQARDDRDRDWEWKKRDRHHHHHVERVEHVYRHEYRRERAPRVVHERQPVMMMPAPVYQAPAYSQPVDPSVNFNFSFPMR